MEVDGSRWNLEWKYMEVCELMEVFGSNWKCLKVDGSRWKLMEADGSTWKLIWR